ncbi:CPBP family intramembrane glutamic endopeptidase [Alkaliphilus peptidifermentans]|uniref:CAAX protease self-immunity n=1 Tax=Alkaliphilus peptidifermentans DSM 18978 TaxID=1120976 RepID=A0A1G5FKY9_9FIRM|nr:CPBP family intramembrane glutamic endopeptidase [Alkaliphilus peptidifermentans]SCY39248.1 CAAX protease self-immunity [Alkaliphilus peptidifermentans DSM 18978]
MGLFYGIISLATLIITIVLYKATKDFSIRYKPKTTKVANLFLVLNIISAILTSILMINYDLPFIFGMFIGLFINYAVLKGQLRGAQSLSDINYLRGSSYLKGKFKWKNIDWKQILLMNLFLSIWTLAILGFSNAQINPDLINISEKSHWASSFNNFLIIFILAPLSEEIVFRFLGVNLFLHWLGKNKVTKVVAVLVPTLIWMFLHSDILTNNWIKYIQILPLGLVCGYMLIKKDVEHSILVHMVFNILAPINGLIIYNLL